MASILCSRVSTGIRHNIAQFCQAPIVAGGQNNTCAPWKRRELTCMQCMGSGSRRLGGAVPCGLGRSGTVGHPPKSPGYWPTEGFPQTGKYPNPFPPLRHLAHHAKSSAPFLFTKLDKLAEVQFH